MYENDLVQNTKTSKATKNKNDERLEKKKQELEEMMEN